MVAAGKSNTTPSHDAGCRTNVSMHNATIQQPLTTVSPNSNLTIATLKTKAGSDSKHNSVLFLCPSPPFVAPLAAQTPVISSQGRTIRLSSRTVVQRGDVISPVGLSFPPALHPLMKDPHHCCLVSSSTLTDFSEG
ncbi:hypothetical protein TNCV_2332611 [Trichonephila clavipes]|nr:hypothetical protein TNCV_2332611 [Trichonephila clavipes]